MNPHLARLDRRMRLRGEPCELIRTVGTTTQTRNRVNARCIVKPLTVQQLVGGLTQQNYMIIMSPTDLHRGGWPGARGPATVAANNLPSGDRPPKDLVMPTTADSIYFRGTPKAIQRVAPVYDNGECVRIELTVQG